MPNNLVIEKKSEVILKSEEFRADFISVEQLAQKITPKITKIKARKN
jgi:hypothetical protein